MKKFLNILFATLPVIVVAVLGSVFVNIGMDWFNTLNRPTDWVPNVVIPIVWTVIYITTATILFLWISKEPMPLSTKILFIVNGVLNVLWCLTFFTLQLKLIGLIVILLNLAFAVYLIIDIFKTKPIYAKILLIYPAWLTIATCLNLAIWILN